MYYDDTQGITTELVNLPTSVKGFAKVNKDMTYTIIINARLSIEQQRIAYQHELEHIRKGDFHSADTADNIEYERHIAK